MFQGCHDAHLLSPLSLSPFRIACSGSGSGSGAGPGAVLTGVGLFCLATVIDTGEVVLDLVAAENQPQG